MLSLASDFPLTNEQIIQYLNKINYFTLQQQQLNQYELPKPDYNTLCTLLKLHLETIPFGCLSFNYYKITEEPIISHPPNIHNLYTTRGVNVSIEAIYQKLVIDSREGYCFEQNSLLRYILEYLGFETMLIMAKVINLTEFFKNKKIIADGVQHVAIIVKLDNQLYLVDAGYGPTGPSTPLILGKEEGTNGLSGLQNRVIKFNLKEPLHTFNNLLPQCYQVQYRAPLKLEKDLINDNLINYDDWKPQYFFYLAPCHPNDIEVLNFSVTNKPGGHFIDHIILSKFIEKGQIVLVDEQLKVYKNGKIDKKIILKNEKERREIYKNYFNIILPNDFKEILSKHYGKFSK